MDFLKKYLQEIKISGTELKGRALENLLNAIKNQLTNKNKKLANITIKHEPNGHGGIGAPDFQILDGGLRLGYIENKRDADLDSIAKDKQIKKYLKLNNNIMLTDYLHFYLIRGTNSETLGGGGKRIWDKRVK